MKNPYLSVVIPAYDEMANLQKGVLEKVNTFFHKKKYSYEVIVVDDGSTDGTAEFLDSFVKDHPHFSLIKNSHLGKAGAVTTGMLRAKGKYVLFSDMDQATPIEEVDRLMPFLEESYDIVIGSRRTERKGAPWTRILMAKGWIFLRSAVIGLKGISDTQCGFKMFRKEASERLFSEVKKIHNNFHTVAGSNVSAGFDVELLFLAQKMGFSIKEVPVTWLYVETRRVSVLKDSIESFIDLLRIKKYALLGKYKV